MTDVIGTEQVAKATALLQRYKTGKAALDKRITENELWFRMGHWKNYQNPMMEGKPQSSSGWLFNSIANKHADAMDNYPSPNVLPRAEDDEAAAQALSSVLPVVLEQADYEQVYSDTWWRKLKQGTGVKGVFWDSEQRGGVGEIAIRPMNLLMLYWEPGVADIQASPDFFSLSLEDTARPVALGFPCSLHCVVYVLEHAAVACCTAGCSGIGCRGGACLCTAHTGKHLLDDRFNFLRTDIHGFRSFP